MKSCPRTEKPTLYLFDKSLLDSFWSFHHAVNDGEVLRGSEKFRRWDIIYQLRRNSNNKSAKGFQGGCILYLPNKFYKSKPCFLDWKLLLVQRNDIKLNMFKSG